MFTKKQKRINWILVAVLLVLSVFFLFPVIWMLANSFKPDAAITADMNTIAAFIPPALNGNFLDNYVSIITDTSFLRYMGNTLLYAAILIVLSIVVNGLAGYALAKIRFPFRDQWLMIIIMLLIVPTETVITIHFLIIAKAGLLNTIVGYILPLIVNPFNIFLFRQVFVSLPDDVYEAAQLDHCGPVKYFFTMERLPLAVACIYIKRPADRTDRSELHHLQREHDDGTDAGSHHPCNNTGHHHLLPVLQTDRRRCNFNRIKGRIIK